MSQSPNESSHEPHDTPPVLPYDEPRARSWQQPWIPNPAAEWSLKLSKILWALIIASTCVLFIPIPALREVTSICAIAATGGCAILTVVCSVVGLQRGMRPGVEGKGKATRGLIVGILGLVVFTAAASSVILLSQAVRRAQDIKCQAHLRMIGVGCALYLTDHQRYPQRIEHLLTVDLGPSDFVCPATDDEPAAGAAADLTAWAAEVAKPGHCSYIYFGAGLNSTSLPTTPVACDRLSNHDGRGIHVLHANGTVAWLSRAQAKKFLASLPPTAQHPATLPASR